MSLRCPFLWQSSDVVKEKGGHREENDQKRLITFFSLKSMDAIEKHKRKGRSVGGRETATTCIEILVHDKFTIGYFFLLSLFVVGLSSFLNFSRSSRLSFPFPSLSFPFDFLFSPIQNYYRE